jgi:hypothetical protein
MSEDLDVMLKDLYARQEVAVELAGDLGITTRNLEDHELIRFGRSFDRQFVIGNELSRVAEIYQKHKTEGLLGAMVAKDQMDAEIAGEDPDANKIAGPLPIQAAFLGVGEAWEDILGIHAAAASSWTTGAAQRWIHSGTTMMGGTGGNEIRIGENAVHIIIGLHSLHASPKIENIQFTLDNKLKPVIHTAWAQRLGPENNDKVKELDNAFILKKDTLFLARVMISPAFGAASTQQQDYPALLGFSYIKEPASRLLDQITIAGTRYEVVHTT